MKIRFLAIIILISTCSCVHKKATNQEFMLEQELLNDLIQVPDSIKVNDIVVLNLFKDQILAHKNGQYDSLSIIEKVYKPHQKLWDSCYAMIFGEENASKFNTIEGMVNWNRTLYPQNIDLFNSRTKELLAINLDSVLNVNLERFNHIIDYKPSARISILFTPLFGIGFGGCSANQFCFELNNTEFDVNYTLKYGVPHELNHLAYEPLRKNDPMFGTALALAIDEGFACYFTWAFFDDKFSKYKAVEGMNEEDWNWYISHEKELYLKLKPYFEDKSGDNPLLNNSKHQLFPDAPKTLYYWLGFRIVENYVEKHGKNSWKDIYELNFKDVLIKSEYESYINSL